MDEKHSWYYNNYLYSNTAILGNNIETNRMIWQKGIGMRGKLKKIIAVSGIILVIVSVPFQYIWANQEDTDRRNFIAEQIIEEGMEYGSRSEEHTSELQSRF